MFVCFAFFLGISFRFARCIPHSSGEPTEDCGVGVGGSGGVDLVVLKVAGSWTSDLGAAILEHSLAGRPADQIDFVRSSRLARFPPLAHSEETVLGSWEVVLWSRVTNYYRGA